LTGKTLPILATGKDVGLDYTAGKKKATVTSKGRAAAAKKKVSFAKALGIRMRVRKKLYFAGARPQSDYHSMAMGMDPVERQKSRALAHQAVCAGNAAGRSATIDIAVCLGKRKEPFLLTTVALVREWLKWWRRSPDQHIRATRVWMAIKKTMVGEKLAKKRWSLARGPIGALIATLLEIGWVPCGPTRWKDQGDALWRASGKNFDELNKQLENDVHKFLCRSSTVPWSEGSGDGLDLWSLQTMVAKLEDKGNSAKAGVYKSIAAGGVMTLERRFPDLEPMHPLKLCRNCRKEPETALHYFYTCECLPSLYGEVAAHSESGEENAENKDYAACAIAINKSQHLVDDAVLGCGSREQACFYLRGLIPASWTTFEGEHCVQERRFGQALEAELANVKHVFVDGSGSDKDPRLRRCGYAVVWLDFGAEVDGGYPNAKLLGSVSGNVSMSDQTVPYAELLALLQALRSTQGDVTIWSDCAFVVNGYNNKRWRLEVCKFHSLWQRIHCCAQGREVQVRRGKAHVTQQHLENGLVETWQVMGNEAADVLAKSAAAIDPAHPAFVRSLAWTEDRARLIRARLYAIHKWHLETKAMSEIEDTEAIAVQAMARQIGKLAAHEKSETGKRKAQEADVRTFRGHPTHAVVEYAGFFVCTSCGARARCARPVCNFLGTACRRQLATPYFARTLARMSKGLTIA